MSGGRSLALSGNDSEMAGCLRKGRVAVSGLPESPHKETAFYCSICTVGLLIATSIQHH